MWLIRWFNQDTPAAVCHCFGHSVITSCMVSRHRQNDCDRQEPRAGGIRGHAAHQEHGPHQLPLHAGQGRTFRHSRDLHRQSWPHADHLHPQPRLRPQDPLDINGDSGRDTLTNCVKEIFGKRNEHTVADGDFFDFFFLGIHLRLSLTDLFSNFVPQYSLKKKHEVRFFFFCLFSSLQIRYWHQSVSIYTVTMHVTINTVPARTLLEPPLLSRPWEAGTHPVYPFLFQHSLPNIPAGWKMSNHCATSCRKNRKNKTSFT